MKKLLLIIFNPRFTINQLFISGIAFVYMQFYFHNSWGRKYSTIFNESFYEVPFETLVMYIFNAVIANALPYFFIKFKLVSPDYTSSFIKHYFIGVLIWTALIIFLGLYPQDGVETVSIFVLFLFLLPSVVAFMLFKKFSK